MNRQKGKSIRVPVRFKTTKEKGEKYSEIELLDKKRKGLDRSSFIRSRALA